MSTRNKNLDDQRIPLFDELTEREPGKKERQPSLFGRYLKKFNELIPKKNKNKWISEWKKNPNINPKDKKKIVPSLNPKDAYVQLYKEALKSLIEERKRKPVDLLPVDDCNFIRNSLPDIHVYKVGDFSYDHLFAKYFLKKRKYTPLYIENEIDIFLYLELYNILKRKTTKDVVGEKRESYSKARNSPYYYRRSSIDDYLLEKGGPSSSSSPFEYNNLDILNNNIDHSLFMKGKLSIYNIMSNLCQDIRDILSKNITNLNQGNILKVKTNLKVLEFVYNIFKVANFDKETLKFTDDLYSVVTDKRFGKKLRLNKGDKNDKQDENYGMLFIYKIIIISILEYDKVQKSLYLTNIEERKTLEDYWKKYEDNEKAIDSGIPLPLITKTLKDMNIEINNSKFEINEFFNILIKIYKKLILLYEYEPNESNSNELKYILNLSIDEDDIDKLAYVKDTNDELNIIGNYSLYLVINLGNEDLPIFFSYTNKDDPGRDIEDYEESLTFNIPILNCREKNEELMDIFRNLNDDHGVFIIYDKLIGLKSQIESLDFKEIKPQDIYKKYVELFTTLLNELKQSRGGRKKRIIKSKKNIIKQKRSKKIIT